jgi:hypothetical protein
MIWPSSFSVKAGLRFLDLSFHLFDLFPIISFLKSLVTFLYPNHRSSILVIRYVRLHFLQLHTLAGSRNHLHASFYCHHVWSHIFCLEAQDNILHHLHYRWCIWSRWIRGTSSQRPRSPRLLDNAIRLTKCLCFTRSFLVCGIDLYDPWSDHTSAGWWFQISHSSNEVDQDICTGGCAGIFHPEWR